MDYSHLNEEQQRVMNKFNNNFVRPLSRLPENKEKRVKEEVLKTDQSLKESLYE